MTGLRLLKDQHKRITALFHNTVAASAGDKRTQFEQLADLLSIHLLIEERHLYPCVRTLGGDAAEIDRTTTDAHGIIKRVLVELFELSASEEVFDARLKVLSELTEQHFEEEENDLFPRVIERCDKAEIDALGLLLEASAQSFEQQGVARERMALDVLG
jgi:hemerythrin superfamily protein